VGWLRHPDFLPRISLLLDPVQAGNILKRFDPLCYGVREELPVKEAISGLPSRSYRPSSWRGLM
jgi:hypothetical protein